MLDHEPERAEWSDLVLVGLVALAVVLFLLALAGCDCEEPRPTCRDWLACYDRCRALELDGADLNPCLMDCPASAITNALGVPEVEWNDALLDQAAGENWDVTDDLERVRRARGKCAAR